MPRKPRFHLPGVPVHVTQRGNNRHACFFHETDYSAFLDYLREACRRYPVRIHAWVLMTNHVHLLVTPENRDSLQKMMQWQSAKYVRYVNAVYKRTGSLWEARYKGCLVDSGSYLLACMRYIEMNPVRARMVSSLREYAWSSYHRNALGRDDALTQSHELYSQLAVKDELRCKVYRRLFRGCLGGELVDEIRSATQTGTPLGDQRFKEQIERALLCRVGQARRGRPRNTGPDSPVGLD